MQVDGAPHVALETRVEKLRRIFELCTFGERDLHRALVGLAGADHPVVIPHGNASPLPFLGYPRDRLFDQGANPRERLTSPVAQFLDPGVDQPGWRFAAGRSVLLCLLHRYRPSPELIASEGRCAGHGPPGALTHNGSPKPVSQSQAA